MKIKRIHIAIYLGLILFSWIIVGISGSKQGRVKCVEVRARFHNETGNHFVGKEKLNELLRDIQGKDVLECNMAEIKVGTIERALEVNPYIKHAEVWTEFGGELVVDLDLRKPVVRVMSDTGTDFYLDSSFYKMDISPDFTAHTVLLRGNINEPLMPRDTVRSEELLGLKNLVNFVANDDFLNSQISEIVLHRSGKLTLYPEIGNLPIHFGKPEHFEDKFKRLELFYAQVLNKVGWEKYKSVSLEFRGQVVGRKR